MEDYKLTGLSQGNVCPKPADVESITMLDRVAERLDETLVELENKVAILEVRLSRVLAPCTPHEGRAKRIQETSPSSVLCRALDETANRIENITSLLNELTARLEI